LAAVAFALAGPVAQGHGKDADDLETEGRQAEDANDYNRAIKCWKALVKTHPANCRYWCNLGADYYNKGDNPGAITCLNNAIRIDRGATNALTIRGEVYFSMHQFRKALADANASLKYYGSDPETLCLRGNIYANEGDHERATADFNAAAESYPDDFTGLNGLAWQYATWPDAQYRNGELAVKSAMRACELSSWHEAYVIDTLAAAEAEAGDWVDAVKYQEQAIEMAQMAKETRASMNDYTSRLALYKQGKPYREGG
jgi:tetratricopeptide (TPR) repeat protein